MCQNTLLNKNRWLLLDGFLLFDFDTSEDASDPGIEVLEKVAKYRWENLKFVLNIHQSIKH